MSRQLNPAQMWSQQPLASRTASVIKSIQLGTLTIQDGSTTQTSTISSVTTGKSAISYLGSNTAETFDKTKLGAITLTNATTVTGTRQGLTGFLTMGFQVVEFY